MVGLEPLFRREALFVTVGPGVEPSALSKRDSASGTKKNRFVLHTGFVFQVKKSSITFETVSLNFKDTRAKLATMQALTNTKNSLPFFLQFA